MWTLVAGLVLFLGVHSISIVAVHWRDVMAARLGQIWRGFFALAALVGLTLIVSGYAEARAAPIVLYSPPLVLRWITVVLMAFVFPLLLAAYLPGRIKAAVRHPMLTAVKTWAFAHLLANGTLADVLLFGGFLAWAVIERISLKKRAPRAAPSLKVRRTNDITAIVGGLILYALFLHGLHAWLIGVPIVVPGLPS